MKEPERRGRHKKDRNHSYNSCYSGEFAKINEKHDW